MPLTGGLYAYEENLIAFEKRLGMPLRRSWETLVMLFSPRGIIMASLLTTGAVIWTREWAA